MSIYTDADVESASQSLYLTDYERWTSGPDPVGTPWGTSRERQRRDTYRRDARAILDAVAPAIAARALREAAESTERETVCCDEYEAFKAGVARPKCAHHICYWGAAHAEALRERAAEIAAGQ